MAVDVSGREGASTVESYSRCSHSSVKKSKQCFVLFTGITDYVIVFIIIEQQRIYYENIIDIGIWPVWG